MNTYSFPLGTDHLDYDAARVSADLRVQRGAGPSSPPRSRRRSVGALLGSVIRHTTHHSSSTHIH